VALMRERFQLVFRPEGRLLAAAKACEAEVFLGTYGNTDADFAAEYGPYDDASHFVALVDGSDDVVGACRLIAPSPAGLKTVNDVSRAPWQVDGARAVRAVGTDLSAAWDVATISVRTGRDVSPLASAALYHGLVMAARANRVRWIVMMLDERARRLLAMAGFVARPIPGTGPAPYLGSPVSIPLVGEVAAMIEFQRRTNPEAHRMMTLGLGLTDIDIPPLADWLVTKPTSVPALDERPILARTA
jgi:hypothetical protein